MTGPLRRLPARNGPLPGLTLAAGLLLGFGACARMGAPPGGPPDRLPPLVVGTSPDTFAVVEGGRREILIRFSERISERPASGTLSGVVRISPETGEVRVKHERQSLMVRLEGGFKPSLVYRVTVLPRIQDLFNNVMSDPFELVFSTGADFQPSLVAGQVLDRITGEPSRDTRVNAVSVDDTLVHVAVSDSAGIFALRYLEPARYRVTAFQDRNRDGVVDFEEPQASRQVILAPRDTVLLEGMQILAADTSPPRLASVEVRDSISLRLTLDDHLDPEAPLSGVSVMLSRDTSLTRPDTSSTAPDPAATVPEPDSAAPPPPPRVEGVYHEWELSARLQARADSALRAGGEDVPERDDEEEVDPRGRLPQQTIFALLDDPLPPGALFQVEVSGVRNIYGTGGGGGRGAIQVPEAPPPDTTPAVPDSASVPPDSAASAPDPTTASPDSTVAPPDTSGVSRRGVAASASRADARRRWLTPYRGNPFRSGYPGSLPP